jgi:hypothetical protein
MFNSKTFEEIAMNLSEALPESLRYLEKDLQQKFKLILEKGFEKLELVTREEFDTQTKVLTKTREKVDKLEKLIEAHTKKS